jgi:quercetin dioxygenase-like cupin family protein
VAVTDDASSPVRAAADRARVEFSPTSTFSFVVDGDEQTPEFFEEHSARGDGPPLHRHPWPTWELVIAGKLRVVVDGSEYTATVGDTIHTPAGAEHTYVVESCTAHVVGIGLSAGRFHRLQSEAAPLLLAQGGPDMAAVGALAASCDVEILGPPLKPT